MNGNDQYASLAELREAVWEVSGGRCEHPQYARRPPADERCVLPATELAHIVPRGMGGSRRRNTVNNTMAACPVHARSTDNLSDPEWDMVPGWQLGDVIAGVAGPVVTAALLTKRQALARAVLMRRRQEGWAL